MSGKSHAPPTTTPTRPAPEASGREGGAAIDHGAVGALVEALGGAGDASRETCLRLWNAVGPGGRDLLAADPAIGPRLTAVLGGAGDVAARGVLGSLGGFASSAVGALSEASGAAASVSSRVGEGLRLPGRQAEAVGRSAWETAALLGDGARAWWFGDDDTEGQESAEVAQVDTSEAEANRRVDAPSEKVEVTSASDECVITDPSALLRDGPPRFGSKRETVPVGAKVRVVALASKPLRNKDGVEVGRTEYAQIESLSDGETSPLGWTSYGNVGAATEIRDAWRSDDPIDLSTVRGVDFYMARLYNEKFRLLQDQARRIGVAVESAAAVHQVESAGRAFQGDGRTTVRFEPHVFFSRLGLGVYADYANPAKRSPDLDWFRDHFRFDPSKVWEDHAFRESPDAEWQVFHGSQEREWKVLEFARKKNDEVALWSASYGAGQVMGFNYDQLRDGSGNPKYANVSEMFEALTTDAEANIKSLFEFIETNKSCQPNLARKDYVAFAYDYNGSGQAQFYGEKIAEADAAWRRVVATAPRLPTDR